MILVLWMLRFKSAFSISSFTFIKSSWFLFTVCHKGGVICVSEVVDISPGNLDSNWCLIQPGISHDAVCIQVKYAEWQYIALMYSFPNFEPVHCSKTSSNCCFLTCIQAFQEIGKVVWYSCLFQNFPVCCDPHSQGFVIVDKAEIDVLLEFPCFLHNPTNVSCVICGSSSFSKSSLNTWNFLVHILLKPGLKDFEHYLASLWNEHDCTAVWAFFGIAFLWDWNENWLFPVLWPLLRFLNLLTYWMQHFNSIIF